MATFKWGSSTFGGPDTSTFATVETSQFQSVAGATTVQTATEASASAWQTYTIALTPGVVGAALVFDVLVMGR